MSLLSSQYLSFVHTLFKSSVSESYPIPKLALNDSSHSKKPESSEKFINPSFVSRCGIFFSLFRGWLVFAVHKVGGHLRHINSWPVDHTSWLISSMTCPEKHWRQRWVHATSPGCQHTAEKHRKHPAAVQPSPKYHRTTKMHRSQMNSGQWNLPACRNQNDLWSFWSTHEPKSHRWVFSHRGVSYKFYRWF